MKYSVPILSFILISICLLGCNKIIKPDEKKLTFSIEQENSVPHKGGQMINISKLEKITYGMTKEEISTLFDIEELVFENQQYVGAYSDIQLNNYMIDTIPFEVIFKFSSLNSSLQSLLIKNSTLDDNKKYSDAFEVTKQELEKSLKPTETKKDILGGKKSTWQSDISDYELHFSEYSNPTSSFLCLSVNHKK